MPLKPGSKYRLRVDAHSKLGLAPGEELTYVGKQGGGTIKDELQPVTHQFKRADGSLWTWKRTTGELLDGWLEAVSPP
jgi:hypothetical protein